MARITQEFADAGAKKGTYPKNQEEIKRLDYIQIQKQIAIIEKNISYHENKIKELEEKITRCGEINEKIENSKGALSRASTNASNAKSTLDKCLSIMQMKDCEANITNLSNAINNIVAKSSNEIAKVNAKIEELETSIKEHQEMIAKSKSKLSMYY